MDRCDILKGVKRIVIKVGTSTITYPTGKLNLQIIDNLSWVMADLKNRGKDVILVSSGAVGVGATRLGFSSRPTETREKQAAAAVGQAMLVQIYENFFNRYNQKAAQVLLTKDDFKEGKRKTNTTNTLETLLNFEVIPVINANDTISTFEIEFSDNDNLSANVASLLGADLLIILTDIDALYDSDPKKNKNAKKISYVEGISDEVLKMADTAGSKFSVGGMITKLEAAKLCNDNNVNMVIIKGDEPKNILKVIDGEDIGTLFAALKKKEGFKCQQKNL